MNEAVALIGDKWTAQRMLTLTLKTLEENGLVKRTMFPTIPPRVDYELTPVGRTLVKPLKALLDWSMENRIAMAESCRTYVQARPGFGHQRTH